MFNSMPSSFTLSYKYKHSCVYSPAVIIVKISCLPLDVLTLEWLAKSLKVETIIRLKISERSEYKEQDCSRLIIIRLSIKKYLRCHEVWGGVYEYGGQWMLVRWENQI